MPFSESKVKLLRAAIFNGEFGPLVGGSNSSGAGLSMMFEAANAIMDNVRNLPASEVDPVLENFKVKKLAQLNSLIFQKQQEITALQTLVTEVTNTVIVEA